VFLAAATVEEAVFRRLVMDLVMVRGGGDVLQVFASAVTFGGAPSIFDLINRNPQAAWRASVITGILGGRSLAPCITVHFLITLAFEPGLLMAAITNEWRNEELQEVV